MNTLEKLQVLKGEAKSNTRLSEFFFEKTPAENTTVPIPAKTGFKPKNAE